MLEIIQTDTFRKQLKKYKRNKPVLVELSKIINILRYNKPMPVKYKNHRLLCEYKGMLF
jgi:mRNA-degrading endonuclease YafQ of YafQ-DinJ toxin-antitoxin module